MRFGVFPSFFNIWKMFCIETLHFFFKITKLIKMIFQIFSNKISIVKIESNYSKLNVEKILFDFIFFREIL